MIRTDMLRWVFFDVGDTLLDERDGMAAWAADVARLLSERERPTTQAQVLDARQRAYAAFAPDVLGRILENLGVPPALADVYPQARYPHELERPFPGATDLLTRLRTRFHLGVIANQASGTSRRLAGHGWRGVFEVCVSSTEEGLRKPDPAIFRVALERAGCRADQAVMVGDRVDNDVAPAKAIGMATIRVRQGLAAVQSPRDREETPDVTVARLADVGRVLGV